MKTNEMIKILKSYGIIELPSGNTPHRKFDNPNKPLTRPIMISRSAMRTEISNIIATKMLKQLKERGQNENM